MWQPRKKTGPAFSEMSGHNRGEAPESQENVYKSGPNAMSISAKHNPNPLKPEQKAMNTEAPQYEI